MRYIRETGFINTLRAILHDSGYSQKELAQEIGLHEKVLSRKLSESDEKAHLTKDNVCKIITALAAWELITTQDEVINLLALAQLKPDSIGDYVWKEAPLNRLIKSSTSHSTPSDYTLPLLTNHNLPAPLTRLVGREKMIDNLCQVLGQDEARLVTLTGPGGSGKTRLAVHVASELNNLFAHGVWFVDLLPVQDAERVPQSILQTLHIKHPYGTLPLQSLIDFFKDKRALLILDNFEQVTDAAPTISALLTASPGLKVLVTSRKVLRIYGEHEFNVPSLDVPDVPAAMSVEQTGSYSAVQLFIERAKAKLPIFKLTSENAVNIARICAEVDGLPLAIELAASRIKVMSPAKLLEKLTENRLLVLTGGARDLPDRHQTLRNTIAWSYHLLSSTERVWFARMSIFCGGWTLEAAETMMRDITGISTPDTADTPAMMDVLASLLDNSLLTQISDFHGQPRFSMLETLRAYALEQLHEHGEHVLLSDWHACYCMRIAEEAEAGLKGPQQLSWLTRLTAERENLLAALEWSRCQEMNSTDMMVHVPAIEVLLRLAAALRPYWEWQGYLAEGRYWLDTALAFPLPEGATPTTLAARAKALSEAARLLCLQNEQDTSQATAEESIALWRQLDNPQGLALAMVYRSWSALAKGEYDVAKDLYEQALNLLSRADNLWIRGQAFLYRGTTAGFIGDYEQMREYHAQSKTLFEHIGDNSAIADLLKDQSGLMILEGRYDEAITNLLKSIEMSYALGYKQYLGTGMGLLAFAIGARGEPDAIAASRHAAQLWGAADNIFGNIGSNPWITNLPAAQATYVQIRYRMKKTDWREAWYAGRALTENQAIALCRELSAPPKPL